MVLTASTLELNAQTSPVVNADGTVTFRLYAPDADEVVIKGSVVPPRTQLKTPIGAIGKKGAYSMVKKGGTWTYTTRRLPSEMYTYYFEVDDEHMNDPKNANTLRDINTVYNFFFIDGTPGSMYEEQKVAHGKLEYVWYDATIAGEPRRRMAVYTPPAYNPDTIYPVLYLLHGSGGDETAWPTQGRVPQILDNMIAQKRCKPMIVVMANGIANRACAPEPDEEVSSKNIESMTGRIEKSFVKDIVGYVEQHYKVGHNKSSRAIAGLSLGGLHTLYIALNNPETFDYIGLFSAQPTNPLSEKNMNSVTGFAKKYKKIRDAISIFKSNVDNDADASILGGIAEDELDIYKDTDKKLQTLFSQKPALFYIAIGRDDFLKKANDDFRLKLLENNYPFVYNKSDGGHTWDNWRKYLLDLLPRLFNNKQ